MPPLGPWPAVLLRRTSKEALVESVGTSFFSSPREEQRLAVSSASPIVVDPDGLCPSFSASSGSSRRRRGGPRDPARSGGIAVFGSSKACATRKLSNHRASGPVTHKQWNGALRRTLMQGKSTPASRARQLERLARVVASEARSHVGDWHFEQTLGLACTARSEANDHRQAASILMRLAAHHEANLRYQQRALVSALAAQALELAAANDRAGAARVLRRAAPWAKTLRPADKLFERARRTAARRSRRG